jgi:hypothetical protein
VLLTDEQKMTIRDAVRQRFAQVASPQELAAWLVGFITEFQTNEAEKHRPVPSELATCATAAAVAYGPMGSDTAPDSLLRLLTTVISETTAEAPIGGLQRGFERVLVFGLSLPDAGQTWKHQWLGAWDALFQLVLRTIQSQVRRFGRVIMNHKGAALNEWDEWEPARCASEIRTYLVRGCDCWKRWQDFHIQSQALAMHHCDTEHWLEAWDWRKMPLEKFIFRAAIKGAL